MIPQQKQSDIYRSGQFVESNMRIAKGQEAWIFDILRNKTYTDKIGSPLREYVMNAIDEHEKLNKSHVPIEITLPSMFSNEVRVRDFARGLTDEEVDRFFAQYGESDKRESNALIGAFGIGCKSAFAYTDSFNIISYKDGVKTTFNMYIDETKVGKLARMDSSKTDEPNGIEIVIGVKPQDVSTFVQRGLDLPKYFKTIPTIKGVPTVPDYTPQPAAVSGKNWKYYGNRSSTVIVQGQIGYEVNTDLMGTVDYYNDSPKEGHIAVWEESLLDSGLVIEVPIGTVELTASREELEMSDFTIAAIRAQLKTIRAELETIVNDTFKTAKTLVEAKTAYYNFFQKGGSYGSTLQKSIGKAIWNGQEIKDNVINLGTDHKVMVYMKKANGDIGLTTLDKLKCSDDLNLYYDDTDRKLFMYRRRAKTLLDAGAKQVTVIQSDDKKALKANIGLDADKLPQYTSVTPTVLNSVRGGGNGIDLSKKVKHKVKVFVLDWSKLKDAGRVKGAKSDYWKVAEIEIDDQVFVPIDRFEPKGMFSDSLRTMRQTLTDLALMGVDIAKTEIYGVKSGIDTGDMKRLDEWALEQAKALPNLAAEVAIIKDFQTGELFELNIDANKFAADSLARDYAKQYQAAKKLVGGSTLYSQTDSVRARLSYADLIKLTLPNKGKLVQLSKDFRARYPMVPLVPTYYQTQNTQKILDYISLVDEGGK